MEKCHGQICSCMTCFPCCLYLKGVILYLQALSDIYLIWATKKKHLIFHCTGCLIRDCYNGLLKTLYNWVVLSPVYHKQPHFFHSSLYRRGFGSLLFQRIWKQSSRTPCSESGVFATSRRLFMSGGWFLYEWGMVCFFQILDDWDFLLIKH